MAARALSSFNSTTARVDRSTSTSETRRTLSSRTISAPSTSAGMAAPRSMASRRRRHVAASRNPGIRENRARGCITVALRIGIDLDGVLADMNAALDHHADQLFGPAPSAPDPRRDAEAQGSVAPEAVSGKTPLRLRRRLTERQHRRLWRRVRGIDGFWEHLEETEPGVVSRLSGLATERRWEIIFLTKRPTTAGATSQIQSQRWLASKGFP